MTERLANKPYTRYVRILAASLLAVMLLTMVVNYIVDPLRIYQAVFAEDFNLIKPRLSRHLRMAKPYFIQQYKPDVIVLGTSRTEYGINPDTINELADSGRAFNGGISGASIGDVKTMYFHTVDNTSLDHLLIGTDFFMFNGIRKHSLSTPEVFSRTLGGAHRKWYRLQQVLFSLMSWDMFDASMATLKKQLPEEDKVGMDGQRHNKVIMEKFRKRSGFHNFFLQTEHSYAMEAWSTCRNSRYSYNSPDGSYNSLQALRDILDDASRRGVPVTLFVGPLHSRLQLEMDVTGFGKLNDQWKRDMALIASEYENVEFWDFATVNTVTTEGVPPVDDQTHYMQWYIDPSHYREEVGNMVLATIFGHEEKIRAQDIDEPLGYRLTPDNVDRHLKQQRQKREAYSKELVQKQKNFYSNIEDGVSLREEFGVVCE